MGNVHAWAWHSLKYDFKHDAICMAHMCLWCSKHCNANEHAPKSCILSKRPPLGTIMGLGGASVGQGTGEMDLKIHNGDFPDQ